MVQGYVDELNAGLNRWETIKKFTILARDLTIEAGEMTPSLKLKRKVVARSTRTCSTRTTPADPHGTTPGPTTSAGASPCSAGRPQRALPRRSSS